jgi:hypothetical protein
MDALVWRETKQRLRMTSFVVVVVVHRILVLFLTRTDDDSREKYESRSRRRYVYDSRVNRGDEYSYDVISVSFAGWNMLLLLRLWMMMMDNTTGIGKACTGISNTNTK